MAATHDGGGYWLLDANGEVFDFGNAANYSFPGGYSDLSFVGMAVTPDGGGYWLLRYDGTVFPRCDAATDAVATGYNAPMIGLAAATSTYRVVGLDGRVVTEGGASFDGDAFTVPVIGSRATLTVSSLNAGRTTLTASSLGVT